MTFFDFDSILIFTLRLLVAGVLTALLGLERELHNKDAGLRTYTLVGLGAALIMIVSQYGYHAVLGDQVVLDPSRTVAQVVSGIGFIGGGLIFVRGDAVRGLTTAAGIWICAAVGMAAGAGMTFIAALVTLFALVVTVGFGWIERRWLRSKGPSMQFEVLCRDERGVLANLTTTIAAAGWNIESVTFLRDHDAPGHVRNRFTIDGAQNFDELIQKITELESVIELVPIHGDR